MAAMDYVAPINELQQRQVVEHTLRYIRQAEELYRAKISPLPVMFNLRGRSSGMYRVKGRHREIRYNPWIFARHFDDCLANTVPHEVAHYVSDCLWGLRRIRPHGAEWKSVMVAFGVEPSVTSNLPLDGIPQRRVTRVEYRCGCGSHQLGVRRHNRVLRGESYYRCRRCGDILVAGQ